MNRALLRTGAIVARRSVWQKLTSYSVFTAVRSTVSYAPSSNSGPKVSKKFVTVPFAYHEELVLVVDDLNNMGLGVSRATLSDGSQWVVMTPLVLPGETVRVKVFANYPSYSDAELVEVLNPSPDRVAPLCPYFSKCGGCNYQHMNIEAQRRWKRTQVQSVLQRIGGIAPDSVSVAETVGSAQLYGYRSKLSPHYDRPFGRKSRDDKQHRQMGPHGGVEIETSTHSVVPPIGFLQRGTHRVVDVADCIIASDPIRKCYATARTSLFAALSKKPTKSGATLLFREGDNGVVVTDGRQDVTQTVEGVRFVYKANEFFQTNPSVLGAMVQHVIRMAAAPFGDVSSSNETAGSATRAKKCSFLIDAYCGSGLFALTAARRFERVYGVEISQAAVDAATANARSNKIGNARFLCASSEAVFAKLRHVPEDETVCIIDPPRKGCDEVFLQQLFAFAPRRVVYVSCDPATQARDAKSIIAHGYEVRDATPFDLFPQTRHIECVMTFERTAASGAEAAKKSQRVNN